MRDEAAPVRCPRSPTRLAQSADPSTARGSMGATGPTASDTRPTTGAAQRTDPAFRRAVVVAVLIMGGMALALPILPGRSELVFIRVTTAFWLLVSGCACLWAAGRNHGAERLWRLLIGIMLLSISLTGWVVVRDLVLNSAGPIPRITAAALFYLAPTIFGLVGLLCYPSEPYERVGRGHGRNMRWYLITVLDGLIVVGAMALLVWVLVIERAVSMTASPRLPYILLFPLVSALLTVVVVLTGTFRRPYSPLGLGLLGTGIVLFACSATAHAYATVRGLTDIPRVLDLGFAAAGLLVALAALLRPSPAPLPSPFPSDAARAAQAPARAGDVPARAVGDSWAGYPAGYPEGLSDLTSPDAHPATVPRRRWWHAALPYIPLAAASGVALTQVEDGNLGHEEEIWAVLALLILALLRQMATMADNVRLLARIEEKQRQLRYQAFHDPLTGLANRALFAERLAHALAARRRDQRRLAVLFCDLDGFKHVNDALGHAAGDELLRVTAARLRAQVRPCDTVARFGGDEFAILIESDAGDAERIGRRLTEVVRAPVSLAHTTYAVAVSIGLVVVEPTADPITAETLLHRADLAMYRAKTAGKGDLTIYDPELAAPDTGPALEAALAAAVRGDPEGGELSVHYRPVADLDTGATVAYEARLAWSHPEFGTVRPSRLLPAADTVGLAPALDRLVLRQACVDIARLPAFDGRPIPVHVSVSAARAAQETLVDEVTDALTRAHLAPAALVLQIVATTRASDVDATARVISRLRDVGVRFGLAQVGAVGTTVDTLRLLPIDMIELHPAFTRLWISARDDGRATALATAILRAVLGMGIVVIAGGIESDDMVVRLRRRGCRYGTGAVFGRTSPLGVVGDRRPPVRPSDPACPSGPAHPSGDDGSVRTDAQ